MLDAVGPKRREEAFLKKREAREGKNGVKESCYGARIIQV